MEFSRTKNLNLSVIKQIELKASSHPDSISLAQGIPDFDTPNFIKRRVERALKKGSVAKYSLAPGLPELREMIESALAKVNMFYDWQKEIIVTAGSIEAITATLLTITEEGDEVIVPTPTYTSYREAIILSGAKPIFVPLNENAGWGFELKKYEEAITSKTKAIFYCNPNNPTGTIYTKEQLQGLADLARKHDLFLISDEVYKDFVYDDTKLISSRVKDSKHLYSLAEDKTLRQRLIRIFSFSKAYAMTGWRIGFLHSDSEVVKEILKVHDSLVTCAPVVSQYAAMGALEIGDNEIDQFRESFKSRRDLVCERLDNLSQVFSYVKPDSSYFVFPKLINQNSSWDFSNLLIDKIQVATVPGIAFGPNGEGHVRISFGRSQNDIIKAFNRLDKFFK